MYRLDVARVRQVTEGSVQVTLLVSHARKIQQQRGRLRLGRRDFVESRARLGQLFLSLE